MGAKVGRNGNPKRIGKIGSILGLAASLGLSSCMLSPRNASDSADRAFDANISSDQAMSALARGDLATAQSAAQTALKRDPKDTYALLVAGLAYLASERYELARQYFQVIISNHPVARMSVPDANGNMQLLPVVEVAQANLDKIDQLTGRKQMTSVKQAGKMTGPEIVALHLTDPEASIAGRFRILRKLLEEELITPEEYVQRRNANAGAMLPLSAPAPGAGLDRPVPDDHQVADRLRMLKAAVEAREMQPREATAERSAILDGLMSAQPKVKAIPPIPPADMLEVAQAVGRLERYRTQDLISPDEMQKEKLALNQVLEKRLAEKPTINDATGLKYGVPSKPQVLAAPLPEKTAAAAPAPKVDWGVALDESVDEEEAKTLAAQIKAKFPEELGKKVLSVRRTPTGKWQVVTATASKDAARRLCKTMRLHRQACEPAPL